MKISQIGIFGPTSQNTEQTANSKQDDILQIAELIQRVHVKWWILGDKSMSMAFD